MPRKTFISYRYSEARTVRDDILKALGPNASYYQGETSDSPDFTDTSTENIKKTLTDMMYDTSVTIVVVSPNIKQSKWVDWEIEYSLKEISRKGRTSKPGFPIWPWYSTVRTSRRALISGAPT